MGLEKLTADDRFEIQDLIAEYAVCDDTGNAEGWASLFTDDGTFVGLGKKEIVGRENLIAFAKRRWVEQPECHRRTHWITNIVITATPDGAAAHSYQMTVDKEGNGYRVHKISGKSDELRRVNGKWRFHVRRTVHIIAEESMTPGAR